MKKKMWQLGSLVLVLVALGALFLILKNNNTKKATAEAEAEAAASGIVVSDLDTVTGMSYTYAGETYSYELEDEVWYVAGDHEITLTQYSIKAMASVLQNLEAESEITGVTDFSQYGLAENYEMVTAKTATTEFTLYIGDTNEFTGEYYTMVPGTDTVYLMDSYAMQRFEKTVGDYTETTEEESTEAVAEEKIGETSEEGENAEE